MSFTGVLWAIAVSSSVVLLLAAGGIYLVLGLKARIARLEEHPISIEKPGLEAAQLQAELKEIQARLGQLEAGRADFVNRLPEGAGINMNRQGQMLRLHRRGESISAIASTLRLPAGEVALTLKVHELNQKFLASNTQESTLVVAKTVDKSVGSGEY